MARALHKDKVAPSTPTGDPVAAAVDDYVTAHPRLLGDQ